jgi:SAM-dependent methyltransferase
VQPQSWAEGYVVDIDYTHGFYRELTPALLRFVGLLGAVQTPDPDRPFTYVELGCGQGHSTALLAAANPLGTFFGVDFNPTHIHNARLLAQEAGVRNLTFLEKSFAELLDVELPEADMVTLHGVYSWISDENRGHILELIRRRLKPGGLVYISYNCLPGLGQIAPLQRLLLEVAERGAGGLPERVARSLDFANRLEQAGAEYFRLNPLAKVRLDSLGKQDPRYVAHEYYNSNWSLFYHADVARQAAGAKLSYVGSAWLMDNFDQLTLTPEQQKLVGEVGDRAVAETIKDFARNQVFRRDVYSRGAPKAGPAELERRLGQSRFALARPRCACRLTARTPSGEISMHEEMYAPVLDALARRPMTFDEMATTGDTARLGHGRLRQAVFGMAALGNVLPALPADGEASRQSATWRFNRAVLARAAEGAQQAALASPVLGSGIGLSLVDRMLLAAPATSDAVAWVLERLQTLGHQPMRDGKPVETGQDARAVIEERAGYFRDALQPWLRTIGVVND